LLPASISTPASGSTLTAAATTFTWTANGSTTPVYLWVGSTSGGNDLANVGPLSGTSTTVTLPTSGAKVYVRLYSTLNGNLVYNSYTYTSASLLPASIQTPASGSTLGGAATTFTWAANGSTTPVYLWIGSTSGNLIYNSYTYTEASLLAASIQSPANGSTLSAQQTFTWTSNGSTTPVYMWIGSTLGGNDLVNIGPLSGTSTTVSLPTDGNPVYVTLWSTLNGNLVSTSSVYTDPSSGSNASKGVKSVVTPRR